jgi:hypothetical protein
MKKHWIHLVIAILFFLFAIVQFNDGDWYLWVPIYLTVVFAAMSYYLGAAMPKVYLTIGLVLAAYSMRYIPGFIEWLKEGMPSIVHEMKADTPFVELIREFLGLVITWSALLYYFFVARSKNASK